VSAARADTVSNKLATNSAPSIVVRIISRIGILVPFEAGFD
jgi:hypothetical protein